jgi:hypothetical protein
MTTEATSARSIPASLSNSINLPAEEWEFEEEESHQPDPENGWGEVENEFDSNFSPGDASDGRYWFGLDTDKEVDYVLLTKDSSTVQKELGENWTLIREVDDSSNSDYIHERSVDHHQKYDGEMNSRRDGVGAKLPSFSNASDDGQTDQRLEGRPPITPQRVQRFSLEMGLSMAVLVIVGGWATWRGVLNPILFIVGGSIAVLAAVAFLLFAYRLNSDG